MPSWTNATGLRRHPSRAVVRPEHLDQQVARRIDATDGPLAVWVEHLWSLAWAGALAPASTAVIPHPTVHLTLEAGPPDEVRHGHRLPAALLHGVPVGRFAPRIPGSGLVAGLRLVPGAVLDLTGTPAHAFTGRVVPWSEAWPGWDLAAVWRAPGPPDRIQELHRVAAAMVGERSPSPDGHRARSLEQLVRTDRTLTSVQELADRMALSPRQLQRLCRDHLGVSPRWLLRRARVLDAHELLSGTDLEIAEIAQELGWCDQAHLTRDYTTITGVPPGRLRRALDADRTGVPEEPTPRDGSGTGAGTGAG